MTQTLDDQAYRTHQPAIFGYIYHRQRHNAEDLCSQVFLRALNAQSRGNGPHTNLTAWLYQITRSVLADYGRKREKEPVCAPLTDATSVATETFVDSVFFRLHFHHLCAHLLPEQHDLLDRHLEGWTNPELANHYGISNLALRQRLVRLRQNLRDRATSITSTA